LCDRTKNPKNFNPLHWFLLKTDLLAICRLALLIDFDDQDGLELHGELAPEAVQPLHARLLEVFSTMKAGGAMVFSYFSPSDSSRR
jgi:hypothetical protein